MQYAVPKILRVCLALLTSLFISYSLFAQDTGIPIKGKAIDQNGLPLTDVSVVVKGNKTGVTTDKFGNFLITVPNSKAILEFSSVGYQNQELVIGNTRNFEVTMAPSTNRLNEIVVTGYGTLRSREVTSAITTVHPEQFNKGNISAVAELLQGKVAGLSVSKPGGDPNGSYTIRLRGLSTLGANTQPLIVLDGVVGADINSIDPNDIKSFDILKDGSAAAIYGTRGSQGVIIITSKTGTQGALPRVSFSGYGALETPYKFTPHMTASQFRALGKGTDYGSSTDWNKEITRNAWSYNGNLNVAGGSESGTAYSASLDYRNEQGVAKTSGFNSLNARLNLTQKALKDKLVFHLNLFSETRNEDLVFKDAFKYATIFNPTAPVHSSDPLYDLSGGGYFEQNFIDYANPVAVIEQNSHTLQIKGTIIAISGEYEFLKGLKFLARYAQQNTSQYESQYLPRTSFFNRAYVGNGLNTISNLSGFSRGGYAYKGDDESFNQLYENTLSYNGNVKDLNIIAVAGYSYQYFLYQGTSAAGGNFITDASADNLSSALDFAAGLGSVNSYKNANKLIAFFGRVNLNYKDFAFLSFSLRHEGSSEFGENNKWGNFPAVSGGIDINKLMSINHVTNLKLRASYGVTGSLPIGPYLSLQKLSTTGNYFYRGNNVWIQTYAPSQNDNPNLKWETKGEFDIGTDFSLWNGRLAGTIDYYNRTTSDLLFNVTVPVPPNAANNTWENIGTLKSYGFEFSLSYDLVRNNQFTWTTAANFSTYHVNLAKLNIPNAYVGATNLGTPGQENTQITRAVAGQNIGILWGWKYNNIDKNGTIHYVDYNKNGNDTNDIADQTQIGNGLPQFEFGWNNSFTYKNFDFNFFFRGSIGHDLINTYRAFYENPNVATSYNIVNTKYFNPNLKGGQVFSSLFVEKGSFVKLDNVTLGYNFRVGGTKLVRSLRAYLTGQNLFTITSYTGVDPEVRYLDPASGTTPNNVLAPGVDRRETWVYTRSFTLGVNIGF